MSHHRRNLVLSSGDHKQSSMDPTPQTHPLPYINSTTAKSNHHPDPPSSTTIQHISNHFSKLYTNHKSQTSFKPSNGNGYPHPCVDTHLQVSTTSSHTSATSLTKSNSQRSRLPTTEMMGKDSSRVRLVKVKKKSINEFDQGQEIKREILSSSSKPEKEREMFDGQEIIKKPYSNNVVEIDVKKELELQLQQGGYTEMKKKRQSLSAAAAGVGGRRRSFCSTQAELANFLSCNGVKVVSVDMPPFMQIHAVDCARRTHDSLEKFTPKTLALTLKKEFDGVYGPAWHCIVGTSFGSFVTHSVGGFLYFSMDQKHYVLLFKTTVQKAS